MWLHQSALLFDKRLRTNPVLLQSAAVHSSPPPCAAIRCSPQQSTAVRRRSPLSAASHPYSLSSSNKISLGLPPLAGTFDAAQRRGREGPRHRSNDAAPSESLISRQFPPEPTIAGRSGLTCPRASKAGRSSAISVGRRMGEGLLFVAAARAVRVGRRESQQG